MSDALSFNSSIRGIQPAGPTTVSPDKVTQKPIDQETHHVGIQSFKSMNAEVSEIKENRDVVFNSGKSSPDAACRHLSDITKMFIAASHSFEAVGAEKQESPHNKFESKELGQTLSTLAKGVESGAISQQDGARALQFGNKQAQLLTDWGQSVKKFVGENENKLGKASSAEKPAIEAFIKQGKELLREIEPKASAIKQGSSELKNSLLSKYGSDMPPATNPLPPANSHQAYRLVRLR